MNGNFGRKKCDMKLSGNRTKIPNGILFKENPQTVLSDFFNSLSLDLLNLIWGKKTFVLCDLSTLKS